MKHRQRDETREPEEHSQGVEHEDDDKGRDARELERGERQEERYRKGPYGAKDEEVDFRRGVQDGKFVVPMCNYGGGLRLAGFATGGGGEK